MMEGGAHEAHGQVARYLEKEIYKLFVSKLIQINTKIHTSCFIPFYNVTFIIKLSQNYKIRDKSVYN